jgi:protein Mpv17
MAALTCGVKASAADYVAQKRQLSKRTNVSSSSSSTEKKRNFAFLVYGAVYQGMGQEYIYNTLYPSWFGTSTTISTVLIKVLFDLLVQTTLLTLPVAYLTKALVYQYSAREAMVRYLDDIFRHGLLIKYFSLWGPVQCITFSIIPEHYRISFIAAVSFVWLILCKLSVCFFSSG